MHLTRTHTHTHIIVLHGNLLGASSFAEINVAQIDVGFHAHTPTFRTFMKTGQTNAPLIEEIFLFTHGNALDQNLR